MAGLHSKKTRTPAWIAGASLLGVAKILENMEIGHNVMHGQWDWMNDPEIHSSNWEWDTAQPAEQWKHSHNYVHHQFTNVIGYDNDIGYETAEAPALDPRINAARALNLDGLHAEGIRVHGALGAALFVRGNVVRRCPAGITVIAAPGSTQALRQ